MKLNAGMVLLLVAMVQGCGRAADPEWYPFTDGLAKARKESKHIVIDFYADWCKWCKVMDEKTFSDVTVKELMRKRFIPIRVNSENTTETVEFHGNRMTSAQLTAAFRVTGFPSIAFLTPDAEIITVIPGYIEKETFLNLLNYVDQECYRSQVSYEDFLKGGCNEPKPGKTR